MIGASRKTVYIAGVSEEPAMIVSKLGDSLIVRLSDDEVKAIGLKEGDQVVVKPIKEWTGTAKTHAERDAALERLRRFEGMMPADFKFNRDEANER
jgi:antitoxin MazE